jgi:DNA-binding NtrC family response regulator
MTGSGGSAMTRKVLFVDDDPLLLDTFRQMLGREFEVAIAVGPFEGLKAIEETGPFAVIVSDLRMPGVDGVAFLSKARGIAPDSVRMMLTGFRNVEAATGAVNEGNVFRILTKPCQMEDLVATVRAGLDQYQLIVAERELLEQTLSGAVRVMSDILALVNPVAFGRATRIRRYMRHMAEQMHLDDVWEYELAGLLSQIGCVTLTAETLNRA